MPRKSTLVIAVLLGILFTIGYAEAAERDTGTRATSVRSVAPAATQAQSSGSLSLSKILRARFLRTWRMLADLENAQPEPEIFGTNGLSDGPDPIDSGGQVGGTGPAPPAEDRPDNSQGDHDGGGATTFESG